jgi:hypothetical protein
MGDEIIIGWLIMANYEQAVLFQKWRISAEVFECLGKRRAKGKKCLIVF